MIKSAAAACALALMAAPAAFAQEAPAEPAARAEAAIEAAGEAFGARMEAFGERAEAISNDEGLSETEKSARISALWAEYQPDVMAFTAVVSEQAGAIAAEALAGIDIEAIVTEALAEAQPAINAASGMVQNGAWASNDPEHQQTYGLIAEYAMGEALDAMEDAQSAAAEAAVAAEAPEAVDVDADETDED